jgi:hypothetical protein
VPSHRSDDDRLFGALVGIFGVLGLGLALWALAQAPPELLGILEVPDRIAALVIRPEAPPRDPDPPPELLEHRSSSPTSGAPAPVGSLPAPLVMQAWDRAVERFGAEEPDNIEAVAAYLGESTRFEGGEVSAAHKLGSRRSHQDAEVAGPYRLGGGAAELSEVALVHKASLIQSLAARALPPPPPPPRPLAVAEQTRLLRRHRHRLEGCIQALHERHPSAAGRIKARVVLGPDVDPAVEIVEDTVHDAIFARCIRLRMDRWSYPRTAVRSETDFVFTFGPG